MNRSHEFALYVPRIAVVDGCVTLLDNHADQALHRILHVLRLRIGDSLILFDDQQVLYGTLQTIAKRSAVVAVTRIDQIRPQEPQVHWIIPLGPKTVIEDIISRLTVLGATSITLVPTAKSAPTGKLVPERLQAITIAAAEQSKQYALPMVRERRFQEAVHEVPCTLVPSTVVPSTAVPSTVVPSATHALRILYDPHGVPMAPMLSALERTTAITCLVGPAGDLTEEEKQYAQAQGFQAVALTESILRTEDAVMVAMGVIRTCVRNRPSNTAG